MREHTPLWPIGQRGDVRHAKTEKWLIGRLIGAFDKHLRDVCGVSKPTRENYIRYAKKLLRRQCAVGEFADLRVLEAVTLKGCMTPYAADYRPATLKLVASALRAFLRFLQFRGLAKATLIGAVPAVAHRHQGNLPSALSVEEAKTLLGIFDRSTARGQRDYAMVRCMLGLGLRAKEVAGLTIEDIDWRNAVVRLVCTKGRRSDQLPLIPAVGRAIAAYLRHGRPPTKARELVVAWAKLPVKGDACYWARRFEIVRRSTRSSTRHAPNCCPSACWDPRNASVLHLISTRRANSPPCSTRRGTWRLPTACAPGLAQRCWGCWPAPACASAKRCGSKTRM